jgi:tRNA-modifying protein YgfZ
MTPRSETGQAIFLNLSGRAKFRVTGTDRLRFLNGQITNDLRKATERSAIEACILNAKGKIDAHVFVSASGEAFLVNAEADLRERLKVRLERYVIADDVQVDDVSDQFSLFHVLSQQSPALECGQIVSVRRFAESGWDIWGDAAQHDVLLKKLSLRWTLCDSDAAEVMRIEQGIPRSGRELTQEIIPIEANLEQRTIDYEKGCYIGQEVISRMKMSGQTNKRLCGLISLENVRLQPGMKLEPPSMAGKEVGWITSTTRSERIGKEIALGYVKRGFNNAGSRLAAVSPSSDAQDALATENFAAKPAGAIRIEVVPLPFL